MVIFSVKTILLEFILSSIYISRRTRVTGSAYSVDWTLHRERQYFAFRAGCQSKASLLLRSVTFLIGNESHAPTSVHSAGSDVVRRLHRINSRADRKSVAKSRSRSATAICSCCFVAASWRLVFRISARTVVVSSREC